MEESKELQGTYSIFRTAIYASLLLEFFMYGFDSTALSGLSWIVGNFHQRLGVLSLYQFLPLTHARWYSIRWQSGLP